MKFLVSHKVIDPNEPTGWRTLVTREVEFGADVTDTQAAIALVDVEKILLDAYVVVSVEGIEEDEKGEEDGNDGNNDED